MALIDLRPINKTAQLEDPTLRLRLAQAPESSVSECYLAVADGKGVAFVVIDIWPATRELILYELFVAPACRSRGFGSATLSAVERLASHLGRTSVKLIPRPLDADVTDAQLVEWYSRRGYRPEAPGAELYCKSVE